MTKGQAMVLRINALWFNRFILYSNCLTCEKKLDYTPGASRSYSRLVDKIWTDFEIFKIFYRLKYLDFYSVNITAMLFIALEVHFS